MWKRTPKNTEPINGSIPSSTSMVLGLYLSYRLLEYISDMTFMPEIWHRAGFVSHVNERITRVVW